MTGVGDLWPQASLRWNQGVHNFMTYVFADVPVGRYDATRLANLGLGHSAVDSGGGYTYFDAQTGNEFSAVLGFTYNFKNQSTQYQNGVDIHLDWGTSKFLTKQLQIGLVGYGYNQLSTTADRERCSGVSSRVSWALGLKSGTSFRSARCRLISTSRAIRSSMRRIARAAGTHG